MRRGILALLVAAPLAAILLWPVSPVAAITIIALSHAAVLYPTLAPNAQWLGPVVTCFEPAGREVWLTIDDGPTPDTSALLDLFDANQIHVTFFVKGRLAAAHPDLICDILRRGHTLGNHSHAHPSASFWCLPPDGIRREIDACNDVLRDLGTATRLFRAPVGMKNPFVHPALTQRGMRLVGWTARAFDTRTDDPEVVWRRLLPDLSPGSIIVLHQGRAASVRILSRVIAEIRERGYTFVIPDGGRLKTKR